jgi:hypothetical protein
MRAVTPGGPNKLLKRAQMLFLLGSPLKTAAAQGFFEILLCSFAKIRAARCREPVQAKSSCYNQLPIVPSSTAAA